MVTYVFFFFFKQKTAYEMRISDWSSDVCSSDLMGHDMGGKQDGGAALAFCPDEFLKALLVERIEPGKRLVQHDELWLVDEGAEQLHRLRHALGQRADRAAGNLAHAVRLQPPVGAAAAFG